MVNSPQKLTLPKLFVGLRFQRGLPDPGHLRGQPGPTRTRPGASERGSHESEKHSAPLAVVNELHPVKVCVDSLSRSRISRPPQQ